MFSSTHSTPICSYWSLFYIIFSPVAIPPFYLALTVLLYSILKEEKKTKGKARLTSMLRSGKELKVFTVQQKDLPKFTQEAKKYGVLYCVLTDRKNKAPSAEVDVIARAEDASKISRIVERFHLASVDTASIVAEAEASRDVSLASEGQEKQEKSDKEKLLDELFGTENDQPDSEPKRDGDFFPNPTDSPRPSEPFSEKQGLFDEGDSKRPSVRKELTEIKQRRARQERGDSTQRTGAEPKRNVSRQGGKNNPAPQRRKKKNKTKGAR